MAQIARYMLLAGGAASLGLSLLHVAIVVNGAHAYRYFGAGERMAAVAEAGSPLPGLLTVGIAAVLALFAAYGFSGAGLIRPLPRLALGVWGIGSLYFLRGLAVFPQMARLLSGGPIEPREVVFSAVALGVGCLYLAGVVLARRGQRKEREAV